MLKLPTPFWHCCSVFFVNVIELDIFALLSCYIVIRSFWELPDFTDMLTKFDTGGQYAVLIFRRGVSARGRRNNWRAMDWNAN